MSESGFAGLKDEQDYTAEMKVIFVRILKILMLTI